MEIIPIIFTLIIIVVVLGIAITIGDVLDYIFYRRNK